MAATSRESYTHTIRSFFCTTFFLRFVSSGHISNANKRTLCALSLALFQHMYRIFAEFSQFLFDLQMNRWFRANCSTRRINWASIIIKNTHERASNAGNFANNYRFIEFNGIYICFTGQKHTHTQVDYCKRLFPCSLKEIRFPSHECQLLSYCCAM